jgi:hypothetical protein
MVAYYVQRAGRRLYKEDGLAVVGIYLTWKRIWKWDIRRFFDGVEVGCEGKLECGIDN